MEEKLTLQSISPATPTLTPTLLKLPSKGGELLNIVYTEHSHDLTAVTAKEVRQHGRANLKDERWELVLTDTLGLFINSLDDLDRNIRVETLKVLDIFLTGFKTANTYKEKRPDKYKLDITISKKRFAELLGYKSQKEANRNLKTHIQILNKLGLKLGVRQKDGRIKFFTLKITSIVDHESEETTRSKTVTLYFNYDYARFFNTTGYVGQIPEALFSCRNDDPSIYNLGRKLSLLYCIENNILGDRENLISISALLDICKTSIPSIDSIKNRNVRGRIIHKLRDILDELVKNGTLKAWDLVDSKRNRLGRGELDYCSYDQFIEYSILYDVAGHGSHEERKAIIMEKREIKKKQAEEKRRKTEARKKAKAEKEAKEKALKEKQAPLFDFEEAKEPIEGKLDDGRTRGN